MHLFGMLKNQNRVNQSIIKHTVYMDYTSTLETLESFSMALSRDSEHQVRAWVILYLFVKVSSPALFTLSQLLSMP